MSTEVDSTLYTLISRSYAFLRIRDVCDAAETLRGSAWREARFGDGASVVVNAGIPRSPTHVSQERYILRPGLRSDGFH